MAQLVPRVQTPLGPIAWTVAALQAWHKLFGSWPTKEQLGVLWGQFIIETGGQACWNNNIGNVKRVAGDGYDYFDLPGTWEMIGGQKVVLPEGDPGRLFRSYPTLAAGFEHHLSFLQKRYSAAWKDVLAGKPRDFAFTLKAGRDGKIGTNDDYFTGDVNTYANAVESNYKNYVNGSYYVDAAAKIGASISSVGKELPSVSEPAPSGEESLTESGGSFQVKYPSVDLELLSGRKKEED